MSVPDIIPEQDYVIGKTYYGTKAPAPAPDPGSLVVDHSAISREDAMIRNGMGTAASRFDAQSTAAMNGLVTGIMQGQCGLISGFDCAAASGVAFGPR